MEYASYWGLALIWASPEPPSVIKVDLLLGRCAWLGIWASVSVVSPTVPETPGHHPQPRVYRGSDADHILPGIIRRQGGRLPRGSVQRVGMRLGAPCTTRYAFFVRSTPGCPTRVPRPPCRVFVVVRMLMAGQLLDRKGCAAHSAGNTRPPPSTPRLPPLRRGLHSAPHSTAKYGWPLLTTRQTEDGCVILHFR